MNLNSLRLTILGFCLWSFYLLKLWCRMQTLFDYFQKIKAILVYVYKHFTCIQTISHSCKLIFIILFIAFFFISRFNLHRLKSALLPHANTQSPNITAYSPIELLPAEFLYVPDENIYY